MPTKQEVFESIQNKNYTSSEVKNLIYSIKGSIFNEPDKILIKDIIIVNAMEAGAKKRPAVVIKVLKDTVIVLTLTTTNDHNVLIKSKSRFKEDQYISSNNQTLTIDYAKKHHVGVFEDTRSLNKAIKMFKQYILNI